MTHKHLCRRCGGCKHQPGGCGCRNIPAALRGVRGVEKLIESGRDGRVVNSVIVNTLGRPLGLELELAEWGNLVTHRFTNFHYQRAFDRSVVPSQHEMVLDPLAGDRFLKAMIELGEALTRNTCTVNNTCGFHVHVGAKDLTYWDLRRLCQMYINLETEIYTLLLPAWRSQPNPNGRYYCKRWDRICQREVQAMRRATTTGDIKAAMIRMVYGMEGLGRKGQPRTGEYEAYTRLRGGKYGGQDDTQRSHVIRYSGLNLHSWFHRGTVEWRMFPGTVATEDLICWGLWCGWMVQLATTLTDSQVDKMPQLLEFTRTQMPGFVTRWVEDRITIIKKEAA
jgi:hypothetical protein